MNSIKKIIKAILPRSILGFFTSFFYGWKGNYSSWQEAVKKSTGYDAENILEKVKETTLKVKQGEALYERDTVLFYTESYNYSLLTALFLVAAQNHGKLHVLDFGGALGSTYFQNKILLSKINNLKWCIIEQKNFVREGINNFQTNELVFYHTIEECLKENEIDIVLLSSVLSYLEKPYELLNTVKNKGLKFILIDRTQFIEGKDRITVQKVHPKIYKASYPCWFFNEKYFLNYMMTHYNKIFEFSALDEANIKSEFKGFLFELKN